MSNEAVAAGGFSLMMTTTLPDPWPVSEQVVIFGRTEDGIAYDVIVDERGRIWLRREDQESILAACFRPIKPIGTGSIVLSAAWQNGTWTLHINGESIATVHPDADAAPMEIEACGVVERYQPRYFAIDPNIGQTPEERLFLNTMLDLENRLRLGTEYEMQRVAGLLRQLVLDGPGTLLHLVNRKYRLPIRFECTEQDSDVPELGDGVLAVMPDAGLSNPNIKRYSATLDQFLAIPCWYEKDKPAANVGHVIRTFANVLGGVHVGTPKGAEEHVIKRLHGPEEWPVKANVLVMHSITRIVLTALWPLAENIASAAPPSGA